MNDRHILVRHLDNIYKGCDNTMPIIINKVMPMLLRLKKKLFSSCK